MLNVHVWDYDVWVECSDAYLWHQLLFSELKSVKYRFSLSPFMSVICTLFLTKTSPLTLSLFIFLVSGEQYLLCKQQTNMSNSAAGLLLKGGRG